MSKPRETMNFTVSFRDRQDRDSFLWVHANFVKQLNALAEAERLVREKKDSRKVRREQIAEENARKSVKKAAKHMAK